MSRGPVVYSPPPGTVPQNPGDVIQSSVWNAFVNDVTLTFNTVQPIEYGGSNAATPIGAFDNLHTSSSPIPSATTTDLSTASGYYVEITGTTTITGFGTEAAGVLRALRFSGILTLTHNATSLILYGAENITTAAGDTALFVSEGGGNWRCLNYSKITGKSVANPSPAKGYVYGLALTTNATDVTNDIDIAAGEASSDDATPVLISLVAPLVKRLDATWAVGTNQGMLDTGSVANSTYYLYVIRRPDTGVVDVLASLSATSPTMPTNYTQKQIIGAVVRESAANTTLAQYGMGALGRHSVSAQLAITSNGNLTVPHALGRTPTIVASEYVCVISHSGFSEGEIIQSNIQGLVLASENSGLTVRKNTTNLLVKFGNRSVPLLSISADNGVIVNLPNANWRLVLRAWA